VLEVSAPIVSEVVVVAVGSPRSHSVETLSGLVREQLPGSRAARQTV
jgi:hypothetical protein